jgi:hypothetical protein
MVFSLEHDIKVTKNHQNLLPTQSVLVAHTVLKDCDHVCNYLGTSLFPAFPRGDFMSVLP